MFLLNVLLKFNDGSQNRFTFLFEDDMKEITDDDIFDKIFLFISKSKLRILLSISCESAQENIINTIKYPTYIESFILLNK
jgi:hypothetical protein